MLRVGFFISVLAIIGVLVSGLVAFRIYDQESSIDTTALTREVDIHANLVQERLSERELLARIAIGIFRPSSTHSANALQPLRASIYAFKTDFVVAGWVARFMPSDFPALENEVKRADFANPQVRDFDGKPLNLASIHEPLDVVMDVEPQNDMTRKLLGTALNQHPILGPVFAKAAQDGTPIASDPIRLFDSGGPLGIILAAAVFEEDTKTAIGFITISYRLGPLMLANDDLSLFAVTLTDPRPGGGEIGINSSGVVAPVAVHAQPGTAPAPLLRKVSFGGRQWTLNYYAKTNSTARAWQLAVFAMLIGSALTAILSGLFGYVAYNNVRLSREIQTRIGFENRLTAVINELNHRVKNILAVIQSIVTRTLRQGVDLDTARDLLIGRIHAMSSVVTLLSDSQWQGVKLKGLFESRAIPNSERIAVDGPDITVSARAAQSLSLLFFELASHSDEGLSLVGKHPHIVAKWSVSGEPSDSIFHFLWEEFNTSVATRRPESDFGIVLLDRVVPEALGGTSKRYFTDVSYVYELTAPMVTVVDENEMNRTLRLSSST